MKLPKLSVAHPLELLTRIFLGGAIPGPTHVTNRPIVEKKQAAAVIAARIGNQYDIAYSRSFRLAALPPAHLAHRLWDALMKRGIFFQLRITAAKSDLADSRNLSLRIKRLRTNTAVEDEEVNPGRQDEKEYRRNLVALRNAAQEMGETLVNTAYLLTIVSGSEEGLEQDCTTALAVLKDLDLDPLDYLHAPAMADSSPIGSFGFDSLSFWPQVVQAASRTGLLVPLGYGGGGDSTGIYIGHRTDSFTPVWMDVKREKTEASANIFVSGANGEGKSTIMKALVKGMLEDDMFVVVFDVDGEYRRLCDEVGGMWIDLSRNDGRFPDPCLMPAEEGKAEDDLGRFDRMMDAVCQLYRLIGELDETMETGAVERAVMTVAARHGVLRDDPRTWRDGSFDMTVHEIYDQLLDDAERDPVARTVAEKTWRAFRGGLSRMFSTPIPLLTQPNPFTVWHLGDPSTVTRNRAKDIQYLLAMQTTLEWQKQTNRQGIYSAMVVDEGQRVVKNRALGDFVANRTTTLRKWKGMMVFATNAPAKLWDPAHDIGDAIWGNSAIKILFAMAKSQISGLARATELPEEVSAAISRQGGTRACTVSMHENEWLQVRLVLPPEELALYKTRARKAEDM